MKSAIKRILAAVLSLVLMLSIALPSSVLQASALSYNGSSSYASGKYYSALKAVSLTGNKRTDIVNIAKSQVGYQEGSSSSQLSGTVYGGKNYTEYGRWYGLQDMWCAMFVSWCANVAGVSTSVIPKHCYTPDGLNWFISRGQAYSRATVAAGKYTPQAGDIIYFKSSRNSNITNHIGIVTGYSNGTVYTIEGNTSSATVSTNGGAVAAKSYSISNTYIVYICKPAYPQSTATTSDTSRELAKSAAFNATYYADHYADLKAAFGYDESKLYNHFVTYGIKEGRQASPIFNIGYYLENNADLKAAFGSDKSRAYTHFQENGVKENRYTIAGEDLGADFYAKIANVNAGLNLSINSSNGDVLTYTSTGSDAQVWRFIRQSDGSYKIVNKATGLCLDVEAGSYQTGAKIHVYEDNGTAAQRWFINRVSDGRYVLRAKCAPGCVMDVKNGSTAANTPLQTWSYNGTAAQHFTITKQEANTAATPPAISSVQITDVTATGYTVTCNVTSSRGIDRVLFPTWTDSNGQDDIIWYRAAQNGDTFSYRVNVSDHDYESGRYNTHIYAYDTEGNSAGAVAAAEVNAAPTITNVQITDVTATGYTVTCTATAGRGIDRVLFPTWTEANGQDDIIWGNGAKNGDTYSYRVNTADHNHEFGKYITHIYAYDEGGDKMAVGVEAQVQGVVDPQIGAPLVDLGADFYAKITNVNAGLNLSLSDTNVIIYPDSFKPAQVWHFLRQTDGSYQIVNTKNDLCLDVSGAGSTNCTNVGIYADNGTNAQRWNIFATSNGYVLKPLCADSCVLDVDGGSTSAMANVQIYTYNGSNAQKFTISKVDAPAGNQMEVIRKIIYAVETGGQVYGNADYTSFVEAYTNTSNEKSITIGAGQWYATEARALLNRIRSADPALFASLDTASIAYDLDNADWSTYQLSKSSAKAKCIQAIIGSSVGKACQDAMIEEQMAKYMQEAADLGVTDLDAQMMCANIRHQGGLSALKRVLGKTAAPYTLDNIYAALQTDTGNQVGAYKSRQKMVYEALKTYIV